MLSELKPCPFCGGGTTEIRENGRVWSGMKYSDPISVSVVHWCKEIPGPSRMIERIGRDRESAIAAWNTREPAPPRTYLEGLEAAKRVCDDYAKEVDGYTEEQHTAEHLASSIQRLIDEANK